MSYVIMQVAFVIIHGESGKEPTIIRSLEKIPQIKSVTAVEGFYEIVCKVEAESQRELADVITTKFPMIPHI